MIFVRGQRQGIERVFGDNQEVAEEVTWVDGEKHGPARVYVEGRVKTSWFYRGKPTSKIGFRQGIE